MKQFTLVKKIVAWTVCINVLHFLPSCKKFLEVPPPDSQVVSAEIFSDEKKANEAVQGLYGKTMDVFGFFNGFMSKYDAFYADELTRTNSVGFDGPFLSNKLAVSDHEVASIWSSGYNYIYHANALIEGFNTSDALSLQTRLQLSGQARFIRALTYFYLVNLFGDVPLILETDYEKNATMPRTQADAVYKQIITDLKEAQAALASFNTISDTLPSQRVSATRWAASALLARVYLYLGDWANADAQASLVIGTGPFRLTDSLNLAFLATSNEIIFQLKPTGKSYNTAEGSYFSAPDAGMKPAYPLTATLANAFEQNDARKNYWVYSSIANGVTYYSPYKYKVSAGGPPYTEYNVVLRLAEQYLIRAEARARLGRSNEALNDLNTIRRRAKLATLPDSLSLQQLLLAVVHERQVELFAEWGHRWFDLKRWPSLLNPADTNKRSVDDVLPIVKGANWQPYKILWPIPSAEIQKNPNLVQNLGY